MAVNARQLAGIAAASAGFVRQPGRRLPGGSEKLQPVKTTVRGAVPLVLRPAQLPKPYTLLALRAPALRLAVGHTPLPGQTRDLGVLVPATRLARDAHPGGCSTDRGDTLLGRGSVECRGMRGMVTHAYRHRARNGMPRQSRVQPRPVNRSARRCVLWLVRLCGRARRYAVKRRHLGCISAGNKARYCCCENSPCSDQPLQPTRPRCGWMPHEPLISETHALAPPANSGSNEPYKYCTRSARDGQWQNARERSFLPTDVPADPMWSDAARSVRSPDGAPREIDQARP